MQAPKALAFDVFGTVVDWRGSIAQQVKGFVAQHLPQLSAEQFADGWRALYQPAMAACRSGSRDFVALDTLHHEMLQRLLQQHGLPTSLQASAEVAELALAWRQLQPWPDVPEGLAQLRRLLPVVTLSNANVALMVAMNRFNGLQWDAVLGAEVSRHYKPAPQAYLRTAELLQLAPNELCLVACHHSDLAAARACGLQTAYVARPNEYGGAPAPDRDAKQDWDFSASSFDGLAEQLAHRLET